MTDRLGAAAGDDGDGGGEGGDGGDDDGGSDPSGSDGGSEPGGGMEPGGDPRDSGGDGGSVEASALSDALEDVLAHDDVEAATAEVVDVEMASVEVIEASDEAIEASAVDVAPFESTIDGEQSMVADVTETIAEDVPLAAVMAETMTTADSAEPASE